MSTYSDFYPLDLPQNPGLPSPRALPPVVGFAVDRLMEYAAPGQRDAIVALAQDGRLTAIGNANRTRLPAYVRAMLTDADALVRQQQRSTPGRVVRVQRGPHQHERQAALEARARANGYSSLAEARRAADTGVQYRDSATLADWLDCAQRLDVPDPATWAARYRP